MNIRCLCLFLALAGCHETRGGELPPQKLLPKDTVFVATAPDFATGLKMLTNSGIGGFWRDPSMTAFRDKFNSQLKAAVVEPLERQLGVQFSDFQGLTQGQMTFAILPVDHPANPSDHFVFVYLMDAGSHAGQLATNLAGIRKKWMDAGKGLKTDKIRDTEFSTFITSTDELSRQHLFPALVDTNGIDDMLPKPANQPVELLAGQSGSLLIISQSREAIEKILARQAGGLIPALDDSAAFQNDFAGRLRDASCYVWLNARQLAANYLKGPATDAGGSVLSSAMAVDGALDTLGLSALTTACVSWRDTPEGAHLKFFIGAPEADRRGLLKILATEAKDSGPPRFVPSDAVKFSRIRMDLPSNWKVFETTLNQLNPEAAQVINYVLGLAGKDKDEKYDLRSELLNSLGDDIITYGRSPVNNSVGDLKNPPGIVLIGSSNPEKLAAAIKVALGVVVTPDAITERDFLQRKIYSVTMPISPRGGSHVYHFAAGGGYVGMSDQVEMLEEFLRSGDSEVKGLDQTAGLVNAAQEAGGMNRGIFAFSNDQQEMRALVETLRQEPVSFSDLVLLLGVPYGADKISTVEEVDQFKDWMDFSLLPPAGVVTRYFNYSMWSGGFTPEGFTMDSFTPAVPASN